MIENKYSRIVSLVPSLTELLFDLGLGTRVAGRTRFCVHPEKLIDAVPVIGGTKNPNIRKIQSLKPDLIIANREENRKEDIGELQKQFEIFLTDINSIDDALSAMRNLGQKLNTVNTVNKLIREIRDLMKVRPDTVKIKTAYFIWRNPWMVTGRNTYINDVMTHWNLQNIYGHLERYPEIDIKTMADLNPDLVLLSSEPFPFKHKHLEEIRKNCPACVVRLVDGQWFSWYGSRMKTSFSLLNHWRTQLIL